MLEQDRPSRFSGDSAELQAVTWGRRPAPALERAAGATAGDPDWTERVASLLDAFTQPCRWPLLTSTSRVLSWAGSS